MRTDTSSTSFSRRDLLVTAAATGLLLRSGAAHARVLEARPIAGGFLDEVTFLLHEEALGADGVTYEIRDAPGTGDVVIEGLARLDATPEQVFAVITDFENFKRWVPTLIASEVRQRVGPIVKVRVRHSVPVLGEFDCEQNYRTRDEGSAKILDGFITYCVIDASRSRYRVERSPRTSATLIRYYQQARLNAWMPRSLMNGYVKREYRHASSALQARIRAVAEAGDKAS